MAGVRIPMPNWTPFGRFADFPAMGDSVNRLASDAPLSAGLAGSFPPVHGYSGRGENLQDLAPCDASQSHDAAAIVVSWMSSGTGRLLVCCHYRRQPQIQLADRRLQMYVIGRTSLVQD
ncbi:hypothetical protein I6J77_12350 [Rhodanobacter sp. FDAARGOS 1247]|uniref:hypothetical protein n=1 Tax=Rhodanobacter sp. FDAARGOS 1247 TaxID=2778082 RepID=UPI001951155A|nr:hypothetical protein [Rhodanobacter sp. FDAARGOS 1247]QRP62916.1 hypothetical protein I6J77_12350 [Rhodanobacter sp. FDAARGOS 1247]